MTQPPYPPRSGNDPGGDQAGSEDQSPVVGDDDPTRRFGAPAAGGQRDATQQFGQAPYEAQPQYGQPQYGQPQYGQPQYGSAGQPPYGLQPGQPPYPEYGQPQYGQQPGQPPYPEYDQQQGQPPQYGQPQYGQPWGAPGAPGGPGPKSNKNTVTVLVAGAVLFLATLAAGLFFLLRAGDSGGSASEGIPSSTVTPDGLGDDPELDNLAQGCFEGDMGACDDLYRAAEPDSLYVIYGGTCAGRQDLSDADTVFCVDAFPGD